MNTQPYPMMTESFAPPHVNPYDPTIQEAKELAFRLEEAAQRLAATIPAKRFKATALEDAKRCLAEIEAAVVFAAELDAAGPLKGIAKTSKAYGYAIEALLAESPSVERQRAGVLDAQGQYDAACIEYEQAETLYHALKYKAGLLSAILVAQRG